MDISEKTSETISNQRNSEWLELHLPNIFNQIMQKNIQNFAKIVDFKIKPAVPTGENFMSLLLNVFFQIELKDGTSKELSYIIKQLPENGSKRDMLIDWKVFDKELNIYLNYIPEFESMYQEKGKTINFGPQIFTTDFSSLPKELIIMEDLHGKGFKNIKRQDGLDMTHTKHALEKLAQFHASSSCYYDQKGCFLDIYDRCLCSTEDDFIEYRAKIAKTLIENLQLYDASHLTEKLRIYAAAVPDNFQIKSPLYPGEFNVLNHGDCWSNNIMFRYNDDDGSIAETRFIDYQMSRYGSPAHDLYYLLISSTKFEIKLKDFEYFISFYYDKLTENLKLLNYQKEYPTLKELHISLFRHSNWVYTIITSIMPVLLMDPSDKLTAENVTNDGEESDEFRTLLFTSTRFVQHMRQLLPWMDNRGFLVNHK